MDYEKIDKCPSSPRIGCINFFKNVSNFLKDVLKVSKCVSEWGTTSNHFPKIPQGINGINGPWVIR